MSIASTHAEYIAERIFLEYLRKGTILTSDQLLDLLDEYKETHPNLSEPTSKALDFSVDRGGVSSAGLIQTISESISDDVSIVARELKSLVGESKSYYERWMVELQRLLTKAKRLEHSIDTLLLLQNDTAGYFAHVSDAFADLNKVDTSETDAKIDIRETTVTLNPYAEYPVDSSGGTRIDLTSLSEYDVSFTILSSTPSGYTTVGDTVPLQAFTSPGVEGYCWVGTVVQSVSGSVSAELKVKLSADEDIEVSRILYDCGTQNAGGSPTVTCQWSTDGYQWYMVDDPSPTKALDSGSASWTFPITGMRWLKFILIKNNYDFSSGTNYEYDFGARSIRLFGHQYDIDTGSTLQTTAQQAIDAQGEPVIFTTASLDACEQHMFDTQGNKVTDIAYYLSASEDGETSWSEWIRVVPSSRENPEYPSAILFGGVKDIDNIDYSEEDEDFLAAFDASTADYYKLTRTFDLGSASDPDFLGYNFKGPDFAVVNTAIYQENSLGETINPNYLANSVEVWRNIFYQDDPNRLVRGISAGWGLDGDEYYCAFFVASSDGIILDFGDSTCIIDGVERTGEVQVYRGVHTFRTNKDNWIDYSANYSSVTTEAELRSQDPLYPLNHKMIIEGFDYPIDFSGEIVYDGVDIVAQYYLTRTSAFDLENNVSGENALRYFSFVKGVGSDETPACAILLRRDLNYDDYSNEFCRVSWRVGEGVFKYLRMRAVFSSTDANKTSTLSSYRIKVGV